MTVAKDPWLTATQAADYCQAHPDTVRQACRRGDLAATKRGRTWMIRQSSVDAWLEKGHAA